MFSDFLQRIARKYAEDVRIEPDDAVDEAIHNVALAGPRPVIPLTRREIRSGKSGNVKLGSVTSDAKVELGITKW